MNTQEIQKYLKDRFGSFKTAPRGEYRIPCPTCDRNDARKMKRYLSPNSYYSKCWICEQILKRDDLLGGALEFERVEITPAVEHPQARILPFTNYQRIDSLPTNHPAIQFLHKDHLFDLEKLGKKYGVGFIPPGDGENILFAEDKKVNTGGSIVFPVAMEGKLVGWQCRFLPPFASKKMKYFHVFPKGNYLFNYDQAIKYDNVIVVEGIKKAFKIPNAVATLGKCLSEKQIELLAKWKKITLLLDGDAKTQALAENILMKLKALPKECVNIDLRKYGFPSPDEMTEEQVRNVVEEAWK